MDDAKRQQRLLVILDATSSSLRKLKYAIRIAKAESAELVFAATVPIDQLPIFQRFNRSRLQESYFKMRLRLMQDQHLAEQEGVEHVKIISCEGQPAEILEHELIPNVCPTGVILTNDSYRQAKWLARHLQIPVTLI